MANLPNSPTVSFASPNPSLSCSKRRKAECSHSATHEGKCLLCECAVDNDHSLPFGFLCPSFRLSYGFANRMREVNTGMALGLKKLHLVLDLDHTLLHTVRLSDLTPEEEERLMPEAEWNVDGSPEGHGDLFLVGSETSQGYITKLRPFVREFLREVNQMFELTVYTMGGRRHSSRMTKLLDPNGEYFSDRVIAQEDCTIRGRKSLDKVLAKESNTLIVDDTKTVWPGHIENLIVIEPFYYFSHGSKKRRARPSFGYNDGDQDSALVTVFQVLKGIHQLYFGWKPGFEGRDVRELVRQVQSQVPNTSGYSASPGDAP